MQSSAPRSRPSTRSDSEPTAAHHHRPSHRAGRRGRDRRLARGHWTVENTVHRVRDVIFGEEKSQVRACKTPAVLAAVHDLIRSAPKLAGYVNTAAERRAYSERHRVLTLYDIT